MWVPLLTRGHCRQSAGTPADAVDVYFQVHKSSLQGDEATSHCRGQSSLCALLTALASGLRTGGGQSPLPAPPWQTAPSPRMPERGSMTPERTSLKGPPPTQPQSAPASSVQLLLSGATSPRPSTPSQHDLKLPHVPEDSPASLPPLGEGLWGSHRLLLGSEKSIFFLSLLIHVPFLPSQVDKCKFYNIIIIYSRLHNQL